MFDELRANAVVPMSAVTSLSDRKLSPRIPTVCIHFCFSILLAFSKRYPVFKPFLLMSRSSTSSSSEMDDDSTPSGQQNIAFKADEAEYSLMPYMFEPTKKLSSSAAVHSSENESESDEDVDSSTDESRLNNLEWCQCGHCQMMDRVEECVCCREIPEMLALNEEAMAVENLKEHLICITDNPAFAAVCLNRWVLRTAWYQYKQQYDNPFEGPEHQRNRHIAYRQLARLSWGVLGRHVRVVLPSCATSCIRAHFPPPGPEDEHVYVGFRPASDEEN